MDRTQAEILAGITGKVSHHLDALSAFLEREVGEFEPEIREMVRYCFQHTGKRIRPILVFYSGWQGETTVVPELVRIAAIVELIHLATLVHDDILDDASIRHNAQTVAERYGSDVAVLVGDALFAHALKLAADFPTVDVCRAVSLATRRVCEGEISQTLQRGSPDISIEAYHRIVDLKTAELFRVSCLLGASHGGHGDAFAEAAAAFGRHLGIAYQIFDDLQDFAGTEQKIGKTLGTDLESGKFTLPLILLLAGESETPAVAAQQVLAGGRARIEELTQRMRSSGVFDQVFTFFQRELATAESALAPFSGNPARPPLLDLSAYVRGLSDKLA